MQITNYETAMAWLRSWSEVSEIRRQWQIASALRGLWTSFRIMLANRKAYGDEATADLREAITVLRAAQR